MDCAQQLSSYDRTRLRFDTSKAASKYAARQTGRNRLPELRCIRSALSGLNPGAKVLDLPCGAGFLATTLVDAGFQTTEADISSHMIGSAKATWENACREKPDRCGKVEFAVQDIMHTNFPDRHFDAVVCNRLFHHFCEPAMRRAALAELARICSGPIIVFYFDRFALDTLRMFSLRTVFGKFRRDRIPISQKRFAAEAASVGLQMESVLRTRWVISPQAFAIFRTRPSAHAA